MPETPERREDRGGGRGDEELALAAREGSLDAFSELVRRHQSRLFAFLLQKTGNLQDAEDLTQATLVMAFRKLSCYRSRDRFVAWLFTIGYRAAIGHFRSANRRRRLHEEVGAVVEEAADRPDPAAAAERNDEARSLWRRARSLLNDSQHAALWLYYAEEMPVAEVGRVLGKSEANVKVMLHRARTALAGELAKCREEPAAGRTHFAAGEQRGLREKGDRRDVASSGGFQSEAVL